MEKAKLVMKHLDNLSKTEASKYQERLAHYLKSFRTKHGYSHSNMAKILGYTSDNHYKTFEAPSANNRAIKALDFLAGFGKISKMSLWDFLTYLKNPPVSDRNHLFPWEKSILNSFANIDILVRRNFISSISEKSLETPEKKNRFERLVKLMIYCFTMPEDDFSAIEQISYKLAKSNHLSRELQSDPPTPLKTTKKKAQSQI